jgi:hypothetical protein
VAALALVPLPMALFGPVIPVTRFLLLGFVTLGLIATEGSGQIPNVAAFLFFAHAVVYGGVLWLLCWALVRALARRAPRWIAPVTMALVGVGLVLAISMDLYVTPFAPVEPRANLLTVLR